MENKLRGALKVAHKIDGWCVIAKDRSEVAIADAMLLQFLIVEAHVLAEALTLAQLLDLRVHLLQHNDHDEVAIQF